MTAADRSRRPRDAAVTSGPRELLWGVGGVSSMLGIATPTLRTWDRRYGLGPSQRTAGGHRRYSESDIARVELMWRLLDHGVPAMQAATVALATEPNELEVPFELGRGGGSPASREGTADPGDAAAEGIVAAAEALDAAGLSRRLRLAFEQRGVLAGWSDVTVPALRTIGDRWRRGEVGIEVEHLVSELVANELRAMVRASPAHRSASRPVLLAAAPDEQHILPLLALEAALVERRVLTVALGAASTLSALSNTVVRCDPRAVFLWASMPRGSFDERLPPWPAADQVRLLVLGGPGWPKGNLGAPPWVRVTRTKDLPSALAAFDSAA